MNKLKEDAVLLKKLAPKIDKKLSDRKVVKELEKLIGNYLDSNVQKLSTAGPVHRTIFSDSEMNAFYRILDLDPNEIKQYLKESEYIKSQWQIMNNPFNSAITFCIRYFKMKKNAYMMDACVVYLTLSMYPSLHFKYFKYEPNENIMNYTINNLSNKFKIKTSNSIYQALVDTTKLSDRTYSKILIRGLDKDIVYYVQAYKTRINSMMRKLSNAFYENAKKGLYLNQDTESNDEEDYKTADNDTALAERISDNVSMSLFVNGPDMKIITLAAKMSDVSVNEIRNTVNAISGDKRNQDDVKALTAAILYLFIFESKKSKDLIGSNDFVFYSLDIYKRANTYDKNIQKVKSVLDMWLNRYSATYKRSQRLATLNNFRKALFLFVVFTIQQSVK